MASVNQVQNNIIRKMNTDDIESVAAVFGDVFNEPQWGENWTEEKSQARVKEVFSKSNSLCIIASYRDEVRGAALCSFTPDKKVMRLEELFIRSDIRRSGLGKSLLNRVVSEGKSMPVFTLETGTFADSAAYNFYRSYGFSEVGRWKSNNNIVELSYKINLDA